MGQHKKKNDFVEDEYVVEAILDTKVVGRKKFYKIKWEGYSSDECTWEPSKNLNQSLIKKYEKSIAKKKSSSKSNLNVSCDEEEDDEPKMKEILECRKENGVLKYRVLLDDKNLKWFPANKINDKRLLEAFDQIKNNEEPSKKRKKNFSGTETDEEIHYRRRSNHGGFVLSSSETKTIDSEKSDDVRKSSRNSKILKKPECSIIRQRHDTETSIFDNECSSRSSTPLTSKSISKQNFTPTTHDVSKIDRNKKNLTVKANEKEEDFYNIEKIVDHRFVNGVKEYRVRWENYSPEDDTWQTIDTFNDPNFVVEYEKLTTEQFNSLRVYDDFAKKSKESNCSFLKRLMMNTRKGITYSESEIVGILDKHYDDDGEAFYLVRLTNDEIIYMHPNDVPFSFREDCLNAERKYAYRK
ncbi:Chromo domain/shadow and Chromo domain-like and Chromo domain-containing protein [Strongyloides ratti]|uniref:Chromo domain/shadow and Chromo domain-like and Chromo domain-containing protein n=1 Tax=Strongyloides ratti TaxID=34506 RepID=A0A090LD87_STRRB|nr:Chromo domain/shadow and Chromo domain-like and Chromo domain-containing protein [Strongyloides ratti]CEF67731.1 Chromo domain/shadow and Chromo domain-like and Chromo domain-containing protein [Strongyloides ratti]